MQIKKTTKKKQQKNKQKKQKKQKTTKKQQTLKLISMARFEKKKILFLTVFCISLKEAI